MTGDVSQLFYLIILHLDLKFPEKYLKCMVVNFPYPQSKIQPPKMLLNRIDAGFTGKLICYIIHNK
jgi:hypothetical protein